MSGERAEQLPEDLREWVEQRSETTEMDRSEVLARAVAAYRFLEGESDTLAVGEEGGPPMVVDEDVLDRLESLDARVDGLESELDEKIQDVRERVIQVKRETDDKAPADHDHEGLQEQIEQTQQAAKEARKATEDLESRLDQGFENYEEVLEYLTETTDELEERIDTLASVTIDLRDRLRDVEGSVAAREAVADLQAEANRRKITAGNCADCGSKVQLGLLASPSCPHCEATFQGIEPASGFFGSATLTTGGRPQLESGEGKEFESPNELFENQRDTE